VKSLTLGNDNQPDRITYVTYLLTSSITPPSYRILDFNISTLSPSPAANLTCGTTLGLYGMHIDFGDAECVDVAVDDVVLYSEAVVVSCRTVGAMAVGFSVAVVFASAMAVSVVSHIFVAIVIFLPLKLSIASVVFALGDESSSNGGYALLPSAAADVHSTRLELNPLR
jgi:hypothetical protein